MKKVVNQFLKSVLTDLLNSKVEVILEPFQIESAFFEYYYKFPLCEVSPTS
jgi:hypothetical protein